jgi:lipoprotein-anchoring transpeptidase ErfK/SrfK
LSSVGPLKIILLLYIERDWTNGCVAVTNPHIEEIWDLVKDGTPIEIRP